MGDDAQTIRVMLCESRRPIGEALCETLGRVEGVEVLGVAKTYWAARRQLEITETDVIVVTLDFHDAELRALVGSARGSRVLFLADPPTAQMMSLVAEADNFSVIPSIATLATLVRDIRGEVGASETEFEVPDGQLTDREFQTLTLLVEGMNAKEMASHLHLSIHTIRFHIKALLSKLNVGSQAEAIIEGMRLGLVSAPARTTHSAGPRATASPSDARELTPSLT